MTTTTSFLNHFKISVIVIFAFILLVIVNLFLSTKVEEIIAKSIGYESSYSPRFLSNYYHNTDMSNESNRLTEIYDYDDEFYETNKEWLAFEHKRNTNFSIIYWSSRLFNILVSFIALIFFFKRRKKDFIFNFIDWICLFFGLFFMRDIAFDALFLFFGFPFYEAVIWQIIPLPINISIIISIIIGLIIFSIILLKIPKKFISKIIIFGFIGSCLGVSIWFYVKNITAKEINKTTPKIKKGNSAINFTGAFHGSTDSFELSKYKDSIVILDFFFSTCAPCRRSVPILNSLQREYQPKGVLIFGINPIEKDWKKLDRFQEKIKLGYPIIKVKEKVSNDYGIYDFPTLVIINKGEIIFIKSGSGETLEMTIDIELQKLITKSN